MSKLNDPISGGIFLATTAGNVLAFLVWLFLAPPSSFRQAGLIISAMLIGWSAAWTLACWVGIVKVKGKSNVKEQI